MAFHLSSPAFSAGTPMPRRYAREGDNLSPPLEWADPPRGTQSFALIVEDPDAPRGTFRHWAVFDIPADRTALPEAVEGDGSRLDLGHGRNDYGHDHYDGPEPPRGHGIHHYHFRLAALDIPALTVAPGASVEEVMAAARPHVIGETELVGTYAR